jgi:hypothetical protein
MNSSAVASGLMVRLLYSVLPFCNTNKQHGQMLGLPQKIPGKMLCNNRIMSGTTFT